MLYFAIEKNKNKGILYGDHSNDIIEKFSVPNPGVHFLKHKSRFIPSRIYSITKTGRFHIGLFPEILKYAKNLTSDIQVDKELSDCFIGYSNIPVIERLGNYSIRDYQKESVTAALKAGRGIIVVATAGGKTLTMAYLLTSIFLTKKIKAVIVVPNRSLVTQTYNDFIDYNVPFTFSKWTGDDDLNKNTDIVITNIGILQSKNSDTSWMKSIDVFIQDEAHTIKKGNTINDLFKDITTNHRFGFTGTMPSNPIDCWNIMGQIGPVIYEKPSIELRNEKYISDVQIVSLLLNYKSIPKYTGTSLLPTAEYQAELDFLINSSFRNNKITEVVSKFTNNSLVLVDYIEHGEILTNCFKQNIKDRDIYFIRGEIDVEERERIRQLVETKKNVIIVAISKIFSTGISIKNLHYLVFASGGKAKIKTLQSIGRGLRLHADKEKLIIFDIADMTEYGNNHYIQRKVLYETEKIKNTEVTITEK